MNETKPLLVLNEKKEDINTTLLKVSTVENEKGEYVKKTSTQKKEPTTAVAE